MILSVLEHSTTVILAYTVLAVGVVEGYLDVFSLVLCLSFLGHGSNYSISPAIRRGFPLSRMTTNNYM